MLRRIQNLFVPQRCSNRPTASNHPDIDYLLYKGEARVLVPRFIMVVAALVVAAVGSPLPDDCVHEVITYSGTVPVGSPHAAYYVAVPAIHHAAAFPAHHYQSTYGVGSKPAIVSYAAAPVTGLSQPVKQTPEVERATAAFMAAWNTAAAQATHIQQTLVKTSPSGAYSIEVPRQVQATEEVKRATAEFMKAWNAAARRAPVVQQAVSYMPEHQQQSADVKAATTRFMAAWEAAAQRASTLRQAVTYSAVPQQVEATDEVKRATEEFMEAWREAASRVPTIQTTLYQVTGTTPSSAVPVIVGGVPQFTPEVAHATAEFTKVWNAAAAAAAAAPDVNIIMGATSHPQAHASVSYAVAPIQHVHYQAPAAVSYAASPSHGVPQPVKPTPEVERATAAFMAAWNRAAAQATHIQQTLVKTSPSGAYSIEIPKQVQATEEVERATAEFMRAWNAAARRAPVVQQAVSYMPQQQQQTADVQAATASFMAAWEAAAQRASTLRQAVTYSAVPQQVEATDEVKRATEEFMEAWREAASRVPTIQTTLYQVTGTTPSSAVPVIVGGVPQFTPEVAHATAEFTKAWNAAAAAAAAAPDVNIIMGASSHPQAHASVSYAAAPVQHGHYQAPAAVSYAAVPSHGVPQPVKPTPEVERATAAFMAAWNRAAAQATHIQQTLVKTSPSGAYSIEIPRQVQATEEVRRATAEFMEAWNAAARRAPVVQQAVSYVPQQVQQTADVQAATASFMAAWEAAAQRASTLRQAVTYSAVPQQVEATEEVKRATEEFMEAWREAASRVPTIQTTLYQVTGTTPSTAVPVIVGGVPQFTPEVAHATAEFTKAWNAAAAAAAAAPDVNIIMGASSHPQAHASVSYAAAPVQHGHYQAPTAVSYAASPSHGVPQPVKPTPEVERATAAFMAAWNRAAAQATHIQQTLVKTSPSGAYSIEIPRQVQATEEVRRATAEFMEAWNAAARRAPVVQQAVSYVPQQVQQTADVQAATASFMAAWEAAAQRASTLRQAVTYSAVPQQHGHYQAPTAVSYAASPSHGVPEPVKPTPEVERATAAFMAAWNRAAAQATHIQQTLVKTSPSGAYSIEIPRQVQATEEVRRATAEFMEAWNAAARRAPVVQQAVSYVPQQVQQTADVQAATASFMAAWEAAAQRASTLRQAVTYSAVPQQVEATEEVKRATEEFMEAWREAASRVPTIQTTLYQVTGTTPSTAVPVIVGGVPQFTPEVAHATAEFTKAWNAAAAAAAAAPDVNIIMGTGTQPQAHTSVSYAAAPVQHVHYQAPAAVSYAAAHSHGVPQPVKPTPEVERATAAFMAAWNAAAEQATKLKATLVKTDHAIQPPRQVQETNAVRQATEKFMSTWNAAARRANIVEQAISTLPQQVEATLDVKKATAEFMSAWHAAAERASTIRDTVTTTTQYSVPQQVKPTSAVQKATSEFMALWNEAADRVPQIETTLYTLSGTTALDPARSPQPVSDTPEVKAAKEAFMVQFRAAERAAGRTSVVRGLLPVPTVLAAAPVHHLAYSGGALHQTFSLSDRIFAPFSGLPIYVVAALVVAAVGSPLPDDCVHEVITYSGTVPVGSPHAAYYVAVPAIHHAAAFPAHHYQSTYGVGSKPAIVSYAAAPVTGLSQPVKQTPEVERATAAFMAAWNTAAAQATHIQQTLVKTSPSGAYSIEVPRQVQATEEVEATEEVKRATEEFMEAWREAASRVPTIQTTLYQVTGTTPSTAVPVIVGGVPQFTPEVAHATAEFTKAWNAAAAAAAAAPDVNIIMGASSHPQAHASLSYAAAHVQHGHYQAPTAVSYAASPSHGVPEPVKPTPEVERATAAFMAAWNRAAAQATHIQQTLVKTSPSGAYSIEIPRQVQETEEVRRATAEFMEAWNAAARRAPVVQQAVSYVPQQVQQTADVQAATASFMAAWEAAAQRASTLRQAVTYSAVPQQVEATEEVQRATEEFMEAWREAASRVPAIQTTLYQVTGTTPSTAVPVIVGGVPQFTPEVAHATAEFTKAWNAAAAAAAAAPDVNIIMGASSHPQAHASLSYAAAPVQHRHYQGPAAVSYAAVPSHGVPQPVKPTPEVERATAAFMAAWNRAAAQATHIQQTLVKTSPSGAYSIEIPKQVQATEEVKRATAEFMEAWNAAARRAPVVQQAVSYVPQQVQQTADVQEATASFMAAWEAAAQRASTLRQAVTYSAVPQQVEATEEVKRATEEFMEAWREAASRVPTIQTTLYQVTGTTPSTAVPVIVGGVPQFTPEVAHATAEFTKAWNAAAAAAAAAPDVNIIMGASSHPQAHASLSYAAAHVQHGHYQAPTAVSYAASPSHGVPEPVKPTPEVERATAAFMAAWNRAAAQATHIQQTLVKTSPSGAYSIEIPRQVQATEEVRKATAEFMEAWNAAARRAPVVQQAVSYMPQQVQQTADVQAATASFMAAWEAAAQRASTLRQAVTYSAVPQQVEATEEVKRATEEFMEAWREAASRVPTIQTTLYQVTGTTPSTAVPVIVGGVPQFTPEVAHATAEFTKAWNAAAAAAAAAPDVNIIMGSGTQPQAHASVSYAAAPVQHVHYHAPAAVSYAAAHSHGVPQPVKPTPEVERATAAFMAAWNVAAEQATKLKATLVKTDHAIQPPRQVQETNAVRQATEKFMSTWNAAARRANVVEQAISTLPQQVEATLDVKKATAEFMSAWHAAAERASTIRDTVTTTTQYSVPQQVKPTSAVQKATSEFMALWNEAADRVPQIETTLYTLSGTTALDPARSPQPVSDTPEVKAAKEAFMVQFRAAERAAGRTSVVRGLLPVPTVLAAAPVHHLAYSGGALHQTFSLSDRIFAPFSGLPIYVKDCV
ncbi:putative Mucin-5AC-like 12 [Homarus americanus]|uniref:Putative Mucin-5AC-like 12 n=1 Tax=Homarus americanus TaxID=6706 RepID=A0A8J5JI13_HOMAM|nr:putative Mucin-5AC-like 12 [Homarus americanus]